MDLLLGLAWRKYWKSRRKWEVIQNQHTVQWSDISGTMSLFIVVYCCDFSCSFIDSLKMLNVGESNVSLSANLITMRGKGIEHVKECYHTLNLLFSMHTYMCGRLQRVMCRPVNASFFYVRWFQPVFMFGILIRFVVCFLHLVINVKDSSHKLCSADSNNASESARACDIPETYCGIEF